MMFDSISKCISKYGINVSGKKSKVICIHGVKKERMWNFCGSRIGDLTYPDFVQCYLVLHFGLYFYESYNMSFYNQMLGSCSCHNNMYSLVWCPVRLTRRMVSITSTMCYTVSGRLYFSVLLSNSAIVAYH